MNKSHPGLMIGYLITISLILLTGIVSINAAKQPTESIYTGFDVT
ncbi:MULTISPECIES: hypothetical protein [Cyanophyceae]|nr:hypothetical protein [Phormidium sp. FACHB-592]